MNSEKKRGFFGSSHPYALLTAIFWSLAYVLTRACSPYLASFSTAFLRCFVAACTMIVVVLIGKKSLPKKKDLFWFLLTGFVGFFLYMIFFNLGCPMVTSATGNVILAMTPIGTALGARIILKERLQWVQWIGIAVAFFGVVILTVLSGGLTVNIGLLWLFIAVLILSSYNLMTRFLGRTHDSLTITAYSIIFGAVFLGIFAPRAVSEISTAPAKVWIFLLILGVGCSGIAYCSWTKAFKIAKNASSVSNYQSTTPFLSAIFGYFFIGDPIENCAIWGGIVIMLGLVLFNFGPGMIYRINEKYRSNT